MHQIHFLKNRRSSFVLDIDNHTIELTKRSNNFYKTRFFDGAFDSTSLSELSDLLDGIECCLINHTPLNRYVTKLSGATVFRLCEALYPDETKDYWEYELRNRYVQGESCAKESIFNSLFGAFPSVSVRSHPFFVQLTELYYKYNDQSSPKHILEDNKASDTEFDVYEIPSASTSTNIMAYSINGQTWLICLVGHQEMNSANTVLECLHQLQYALSSHDRIALKNVVSRLGHLGALSLMEMLFRDETYEFFSALAEQIARDDLDYIKEGERVFVNVAGD